MNNANTNVKWVESELKNLIMLACDELITIHNIDAFSQILINNANFRTNISKENIKEKNTAFYNYLAELSENCSSIEADSQEFKKLCSMFRIPIINNNSRSEEEMLPGDDTRQKSKESGNILNKQKGSMSMRHEKIGFMPDKTIFTHKDCLEMFNKLSPEEQIKFVVKFQNVEIKLSPSDILVIKSL